MNKVLKFKFSNIAEIEFYRKNLDNFSINGEDCEVTLTVGLQVHSEPRDEIVYVFDVAYVDKRDKQILLTYKAHVAFNVFEFGKNFEIMSDNSVELPEHFMATTMNLAIGSLRGMLAIKNVGSYLEKVYLPIFDPLLLMKGFHTKNSSILISPSE